MPIVTTLLLVMAALSGAAGVAFAAIAAHGTGDARLMGSAAEIALVHGPALLALAALPRTLRLRPAAGLVLAGGVALFSGDLAFRFFTGGRLFEGAAPAGGTLLIAGWLTIAIGAVASSVKPRPKGETT